jgi:hypothetical protein
MRSKIFTALITVYYWTLSEPVTSTLKFTDFFFKYYTHFILSIASHFRTLFLPFTICDNFLRDLIRSDVRLTSPALVLSNLFTSCFRHLILFIFANHFISLLGPEIKYSYNKSQMDALFLKFVFDKELSIFRTDLLSIIRSLNTVYAAIVICLLADSQHN